MQEPTRRETGKADAGWEIRANRMHQSCRGNGDGMHTKETRSNTGSPCGDRSDDQPEAREGQAGPHGMSERLIVPKKPGNAGGGKEPQLETNERSDEGEGIGDEPSTPESVQKLQTALHDKAKRSPNFRFYALYDKMYRKDMLAFAYACSKANGGAAGVNGQTFEDIDSYGAERWLDELTLELKNRTYRPLPVRRVNIPKADGKRSGLGMPAIRDRVAMMAAVLVFDPIFEADLHAEQYAYRRDHSALDAVRHVHKLINTGHVEIVDADLSRIF